MYEKILVALDGSDYSSTGGNVALDAAVTGSYLYGIWSTVGSASVSEFIDDIDITGTRIGLRVGLTLNPGVVR